MIIYHLFCVQCYCMHIVCTSVSLQCNLFYISLPLQSTITTLLVKQQSTSQPTIIGGNSLFLSAIKKWIIIIPFGKINRCRPWCESFVKEQKAIKWQILCVVAFSSCANVMNDLTWKWWYKYDIYFQWNVENV